MNNERYENILWYAIQTNSRHEQVVYDRLSGKDFEIFLPKIEVWSRRKDRKKRIQVPMFRGYLFVHTLLQNDNWLSILKTPGVASIISTADGPASIPEDEINSIRILLDNDTLVNPYPFLEVGKHVRVVNGPLAGAEGILLETREEKNKLIVSVTLLQRSVSVEIDVADVIVIT